MRVLFHFALAGLAAALLAGCASYEQVIAPSASLDNVKHFFVLTNPNDSRGIAHQIVGALRVRDRRAETGPATMMPEETQMIVTYEDAWSWDFGEHLVYLQISVRDRRSNVPASTARFATRLPSRRSTAQIVSDVVEQVLSGQK